MAFDVTREAWRSSELPMNLNSHKHTSGMLEGLAAKHTVLSEHVASPITALF